MTDQRSSIRPEPRRLIEASGLPESIRETIHAILVKSRLPEKRQAQIARELVAHFEDGLASGSTAEELLEAFGDVDMTAKLIARAKPQSSGRPKPRFGGEPFRAALPRNIRYGFRQMRQSPGFTVIAILSLTLGIGANTAIFSLVNAVLFRDLPIENPEEVYNLYESRMSSEWTSFSNPDYRDVREGTRDVFSGVSASQFSMASLDTDGQAGMVMIELVTGNYFSLLGVRPYLGRLFTQEDDVAPGAHPVILLSQGYWERALGADPTVVGTDLRLSGRLYTIVGIVPGAYTGTVRGLVPDLYGPMMMINEFQPVAGQDQLERRNSHSLFVKGRLKPGATPEQARVALAGVAASIRERFPDDWPADYGIRMVPTEDVIVFPPVDRFITPSAAMLMVVVGIVLLIACVNLASFLLARALDRKREIAIRLALGATRGSLIGQLVVETTLLGVLGGVGGVGLALWLLRLLVTADLPLPVPLTLDLPLDGTVLGFALAISIASGVLFGLIPAFQATKPDVAGTLKDESAGGGQPGKVALRNALVISQVAMSLVLLVGAGLFIRSLRARQAVDPGFGRDPAVVVWFALPGHYDQESGREFLRTLTQAVSQVPGVTNVGLIGNIHLNSLSTQDWGVNVDGVEPPPGRPDHSIDYAPVDEGYFGAAGMRLLRGRNFAEIDNEAEDAVQAVIVNETMARKFWPGSDAVGARVRHDTLSYQVVGVVSDAKIRFLGEAPRPFLYRPYRQTNAPGGWLIAQTAKDAESAIAEVLAVMRRLDPEMLIMRGTTMERHLATMLLPAQLAALLLGVFAALALALASVGLYGLVSYAVARRTREVGIRMSLGADGSRVVRVLIGGGMRLVLIGSAIGLVLSLALSRLLGRMLFGVATFDPVTFIGVPLILGGVALLASYVPARRASRINPVNALKGG